MKDAFYLLLLSAFCISLSCNPVFYSPDPHNNPLISEKGETNLGANIGISDDSHNWGIHGSYGITESFAFKFNGNFYKSNSEEDHDFNGSGRIIELAPGYYRKIGNKFVFNSYLLLANGRVENRHLNTSDLLTADIFRYGLQPEIGFKSETIECILSSRFVHLHHYNFQTTTYPLSTDPNQPGHNNLLIEPAFTLRFGAPRVKFQTQLGLSFNPLDDSFRQEHFYLGVGAHVNLNLLELRK